MSWRAPQQFLNEFPYDMDGVDKDGCPSKSAIDNPTINLRVLRVKLRKATAHPPANSSCSHPVWKVGRAKSCG